MNKHAIKNTRNQFSKNSYFIFSYFISCAFIGWLFETIAVWILENSLTTSGFLFIGKNISHYIPFLKSLPLFNKIPFIWGLPIIEIYGIGGCIIVLLFSKLKNKPLFLFMIAMITMTIFELISSYFCSYIVHHSYWDYSKEFMNFQGRICLRSSIAWGIMAVVTIKMLKSRLELIYAKERRMVNYKNIMRIVFIYTIICNIYKFVVLK